jgi:hypothetical protein
MNLHVAATSCVGVKSLRFKTPSGTEREHGKIVVVSYAPDNAFPYEHQVGPDQVVETQDMGQPQP